MLLLWPRDPAWARAMGAARGQGYSRAASKIFLYAVKKWLAALRTLRGSHRVGDELHPLGRVKDFALYAAKITSSGAQAVLTGNFGNDRTLLLSLEPMVGYNQRLC